MDRRKALASFAMVLVLCCFVVRRWQDHFEEQQAELISAHGAGRALALALVIDQSSGLPRLVYGALWPNPSEIRLFVASKLSETIPVLESTRGGDEALRDAREAYIAATNANERALKSFEANPPWMSPGETAGSEGNSRDPWLALLLRYREGDVTAIAPARGYLKLVSAVRLVAWILAISSVVILLHSRIKPDERRKRPEWQMLYWWLQALCLFVVGIDILEKLMLEAQSQFTFMLSEVAQAVVLIAVSVLVFRRVGFSRSLSSSTIESSLRWSVVGVGLIIGLNGIRAWFAGELSPMLYQGRPLGITSYRMGLIIVPSIVLVPVVEEMLFREMLYRATRAWLGWASWLAVSSLLFASIHVGAVEHLTFATLTGISLGVVRERSGSVVPCLVAHSVINGWWWLQDALIAFAAGPIL